MSNKNINLNTDFDIVRLSLASPKLLRVGLMAEVTKSETINYRTQRSERYGLLMRKFSDLIKIMNVIAVNTRY